MQKETYQKQTKKPARPHDNSGAGGEPRTLIGIEKMSVSATRWIGSTVSLVVHTLFFIGAFVLYFTGFELDKILLVLTTIVSLEAIYLSIFIQMTINRNTRDLLEVSEDIDEIQEDVDEIQKDVDEIQEDVDEIQKDVGDLEEDFEEISEEIEKDDEEEKMRDKELIDRIEGSLKELMSEINELKKKN